MTSVVFNIAGSATTPVTHQDMQCKTRQDSAGRDMGGAEGDGGADGWKKIKKIKKEEK